MKYIIEIEDTPYTEPTSEIELYKATNFNSLVFDQNELNKLEKFDSNEEYDRGYSQGIEDCEKAIDTLGSFTLEELEEEFGTKVFTGILLENPLQDIVAITKAYKEKKKAEEDTIKVGDVVRYNKKCHQYDLVKDREYLVLHVFDNDTCSLLYDNGDTCCAGLDILEPTGRHIDEVSQLLDKLRGEKSEIIGNNSIL